MYPPAPLEFSGENVPRPPWRAHTIALTVSLAALFLVMVGTNHDTLNRIFIFVFLFLPLAVTHALVSTLLVRHVARSRPVLPTWRVLLQAHMPAVFMGLAVMLFVSRFF